MLYNSTLCNAMVITPIQQHDAQCTRAQLLESQLDHIRLVCSVYGSVDKDQSTNFLKILI